MKDTDFLRHDPVSRINIIDKMLFLAGAICIGIPSPALLQTAATGEVSAAWTCLQLLCHAAEDSFTSCQHKYPICQEANLS